MALSNIFYNTFVKRNSEPINDRGITTRNLINFLSSTGIYVTTIFAGAFTFGIGFDAGVTKFWDTWNKGKQWKDIRGKYVESDS
ncbi:hypothetical protein BV25DRAFT_1986524 [Artomyces pyxidatus]|uniref:Uncharacterized protein n=1 Tax=Artomyces pyxidatus TaxID=48021 RepID=A0ACB8TKQ6_9AGAM|nr:hypothetical protein BV25DRAFT_1986524 [Artomyces pyxidatus]